MTMSNIPNSSSNQEPRLQIRGLAGSKIRKVANGAMSRPDVLPFWFDESDQATAPFIQQAAIESITEGETFYAQNLGRPYLREAIATYLSNLHDKQISPESIVITASGVSGLMLTGQDQEAFGADRQQFLAEWF
ncbi:pyridoxal phosphate-dependent aminotransferase [Pseudomonas sp. S31]|uniref:hypothetical protein n=1 Tax=Pseudomonas sp. S31 TaxID=1564473 RepID=UPI00191307C2|nr:hypothetical protein [Pseudomonas sp. S31]MBK4998592.1 pyridoxal phosphate-dependent aminotransferase [Pseudomonas sp. S31]